MQSIDQDIDKTAADESAQSFSQQSNDNSTKTASGGSNQQSTSSCQKFIDIVHKSLSKGHDAIDTLAIIDECYGEDAAIFADSKEVGQQLLAGLLDAALQKIDESVKEDAVKLIKEEAETVLNHLDQAVGEINRREQVLKEAEDHDRQSALDARRMSKLPDGVSIRDVIAYQAYLIKKETENSLIAQLEKAKEECEALEKSVDEKKAAVHSKIKDIEMVHQNLGEAADACSFGGVS